MKPEALLALLALIAAVLAIVPPERRLDIRIRLGWPHWLVILAVGLVVHVITFMPVLLRLGVRPLGDWRWGFEPDTASYALLLVAAILVTMSSARAPLARRKLPLFRRQVELLLGQNRYGELSFLMQRHFSVLRGLASGNGWFEKLRERLSPSSNIFDLSIIVRNLEDEARDAHSKPTRLLSLRLRRWLEQSLDDFLSRTGDRYREYSSSILRRVLLDEQFVAFIAKSDLELALRVVEANDAAVRDFEEMWFEAMLAYPGSVLYFELEEAQNISGLRFNIPEHCAVLNFYFRDAKMAEDRAPYKPAGDYALRLLDEHKGHGLSDRYNQDLGGFRERERARDPISAVIHFFDIMVREAAFQNIPWHMWLYYMPPMVEEILKNMVIADDINGSRDENTPYETFLQDIVSNLCDWVLVAKDMTPNSPHYAPASVDVRHENGNIPKSAARALGQTWRYLVASEGISGGLKAQLLTTILRSAKDLRGSERLDQYRRILLLSIATGGDDWNEQRLREHKRASGSIFESVDWVLAGEVEEELKPLLAGDERLGRR